ncbi:MAG: YbjN domain-containing protein [Blastocatellia bacterium]
MRKKIVVAIPVALAIVASHAFAQQTEQPQTQPPKVVKPAPRLTFADKIKQYLQQLGATIDPSKSTPDMVVSNYPDQKGGKTTVVIVNDRRKNLVGLYIYNFGSLKTVTNREEVYKYLLTTNDAITIGSFFVDGDDDIGYKYMIISAQSLTLNVFDSIYTTMTTVARERKTEIRQLLGTPPGKDDKPSDARKAAEDKPPFQ